MGRVREIRRLRRMVRIGAPDPRSTRFSGMAAVTELIDHLNMITLLEAAIGPIKTRDRGFTGAPLGSADAARPDRGNPVLTKEERPRKRPSGE